MTDSAFEDYHPVIRSGIFAQYDTKVSKPNIMQTVRGDIPDRLPRRGASC